MTKQKVLELVDQLPSDASIDDVMERLYFLAKVECGLEEGERRVRRPRETRGAPGLTTPFIQAGSGVVELGDCCGPVATGATVYTLRNTRIALLRVSGCGAAIVGVGGIRPRTPAG